MAVGVSHYWVVTLICGFDGVFTCFVCSVVRLVAFMRWSLTRGAGVGPLSRSTTYTTGYLCTMVRCVGTGKNSIIAGRVGSVVRGGIGFAP